MLGELVQPHMKLVGSCLCLLPQRCSWGCDFFLASLMGQFLNQSCCEHRFSSNAFFRLLVHLKVQEQLQGDENLLIEELENKTCILNVGYLFRFVCIRRHKNSLSQDKSMEDGPAGLLC